VGHSFHVASTMPHEIPGENQENLKCGAFFLHQPEFKSNFLIICGQIADNQPTNYGKHLTFFVSLTKTAAKKSHPKEVADQTP
jgi:hypothetical protein